MIIRPATAGDRAAIARVVDAAFGGPDEARIVDGVRAEGAALVDLVAEDNGVVVGHILFSQMTTHPRRFIAGLGPLAVAPERHGQGVGTQLGEAGVQACRALGVEAIVVLGHPPYYPRFGFSAEAAAKVASPFAGRPSWMAMELTPGTLTDPIKVDYPAAFG